MVILGVGYPGERIDESDGLIIVLELESPLNTFTIVDAAPVHMDFSQPGPGRVVIQQGGVSLAMGGAQFAAHQITEIYSRSYSGSR